jgi:hypothetical protein
MNKFPDEVYRDNYIIMRKKLGIKLPNFKYLGLQTLYDFSNWCNENYYYWCKNILSLNLGTESIRTLWLLFWMDTQYKLRWNDNLTKWIKDE